MLEVLSFKATSSAADAAGHVDDSSSCDRGPYNFVRVASMHDPGSTSGICTDSAVTKCPLLWMEVLSRGREPTSCWISRSGKRWMEVVFVMEWIWPQFYNI